MAVTDKITQRHANNIAVEYNFSPFENLKCERAIGDRPINTMFLATKTGECRVLVLYNEDELIEP